MPRSPLPTPHLARAFRVAATLLAISTPAAAQSAPDPKSGPLYEELARMDRLLFETAFVACDAERFATFFTEDAEFYHDKVAPTFSEEVTRLQSCPRENGVRRVLVPESLEVYPMADSRAIQTGEHHFVEEGADTYTVAKFVHLWHRRDGAWRISRVLSYDHRPVAR